MMLLLEAVWLKFVSLHSLLNLPGTRFSRLQLMVCFSFFQTRQRQHFLGLGGDASQGLIMLVDGGTQGFIRLVYGTKKRKSNRNLLRIVCHMV